MGVKLTAVGRYLPEKVLTNREMEKIVNTSDEWIRLRTGIHERRIASSEESTSSLAIAAAKDVIQKRGLNPAEIDLILVATMMGDSPFPSTACKVQHALGADQAAAFDVVAACSGFVYALETAAQFVKTGAMKKVLVIGSEVYSRFLDWEDRKTCVLFGDGAGAALLEYSETDRFLGGVLKADGSGRDLLHMPAGGTAIPASAETVQNRDHFLKMKGLELFQAVVPMIAESILDTCDKAGYTLDDIDLIVPHQANVHIIEAVADALGIQMERFLINIAKYGNTSAASIPLGLYDALEQEKIKSGDLVLMVGFGAGLTCAASLIRWDESFVF